MVKFTREQRLQNITSPSGDDIYYVRERVIKLQHSGELQEMKSVKKT